MSLPNDPVEALKWASRHWDSTWWIIGAVGVFIAWTRKRLADWSRRNSLATGVAPAVKPVAAQASSAASAASAAPAAAGYSAAAAYAAAGYTAQPAYAAAVASAPQQAPSSARKLYREAAAPQQRAVAPVARSVNVPAVATVAGADRWTLAGAFGDPAHARNAIIVAEVLAPPVALR